VWERAGNLVLGLVFAGWAIRAVVAAEESDRFSLVRLGLAGLQVLVGLLFILREPARRHAGWAATLAALPALFLGGAAISSMPAAHTWSAGTMTLFAVGLILTVASFATLGRSFCILPGERSIVTSGPYAVVRHPAYAGELLILASIFLAAPNWITGGILLAELPAIALRIWAEERLLGENEEYQAYAERVPWRLAPWIW
jgi:protein-S-isoprenylcysteine O-methyltransferase Ste14